MSDLSPVFEVADTFTFWMDISEIERMLKALIKSLQNKPLAQTDQPYYIANKLSSL